MKRKILGAPIIIFIISLSLFPPPVKATPFDTPQFIDGETLRYTVKATRKAAPEFTGPVPVEFVNSFRRTQDESGRKVIRQTTREVRDNGTVSLWKFDYSDTGATTRSVYFSHSIQTPGGVEFFNEYAAFDDPSLKYPDSIVHGSALPYILAGTHWKNQYKRDVYIWAQDSIPTHIFVQAIGEEKIVLQIGAFQAWRVHFTLDRKAVIEPWGVFGSIIAKLIPDFTFWYDKQPPHRLLRVKTDFGPANPIYIQDLVEIR